ncbi:sugar phosphate isomerase/epimerase family protein [Amnibacterium flavum]|uniref:Xylose isomerase-like TIM barrel domain-containing protein n=1 Tax=Amnibacterium flavum TaxID=2173173 RepID=A0A2V1HXG0_9MICO|nr:sugar phosphate isomerase/epimerase [Amnibacterium flavum]PVZ95970.1 hypothetical protein DDQ50_05820 [Amnibacterium flavum]
MIKVGMSTSCVFPASTERAFALARSAGYDGIEVMVTRDRATQDADTLRSLSERYELPILSVHAPVLLLTHFVWGRDPRVKLERSAGLAAELGASTVVVHPPFTWQRSYARRFAEIVAETRTATGVEIAVENMFPWKVRGLSVAAYAPGWDPTGFDFDAVTLDFSHAALSGRDALGMAELLGDRVRHIHLCDGSGSLDEGKIFDEHLLPGRGGQPVAETLQWLARRDWDGSVIAEVNIRSARNDTSRLALLRETLEFARANLAVRQTGADQDGSRTDQDRSRVSS